MHHDVHREALFRTHPVQFTPLACLTIPSTPDAPQPYIAITLIKKDSYADGTHFAASEA